MLPRTQVHDDESHNVSQANISPILCCLDCINPAACLFQLYRLQAVITHLSAGYLVPRLHHCWQHPQRPGVCCALTL